MAERVWYVSAYYSVDAQPPKIPGRLAFTRSHTSEASANAEVRSAESQVEIERVVKEGPFEMGK